MTEKDTNTRDKIATQLVIEYLDQQLQQGEKLSQAKVRYAASCIFTLAKQELIN